MKLYLANLTNNKKWLSQCHWSSGLHAYCNTTVQWRGAQHLTIAFNYKLCLNTSTTYTVTVR